MTFRFEVTLKTTWATPEAFFDLADRLHAACNDASVGVQTGIATAEFTRDDDSFRSAVIAAVRDLHKAGFRVESVHTDESDAVAELNESIAAGRLLPETAPTPTA